MNILTISVTTQFNISFNTAKLLNHLFFCLESIIHLDPSLKFETEFNHIQVYFFLQFKMKQLYLFSVNIDEIIIFSKI